MKGREIMAVHFGLKFDNKIPPNMVHTGRNVRAEADNLAVVLNKMVPSNELTLEVKPYDADTSEKVSKEMADFDEMLKRGLVTTPDPAKPGYPFMLYYSIKSADGKELDWTDGWSGELIKDTK